MDLNASLAKAVNVAVSRYCGRTGTPFSQDIIQDAWVCALECRGKAPLLDESNANTLVHWHRWMVQTIVWRLIDRYREGDAPLLTRHQIRENKQAAEVGRGPRHQVFVHSYDADVVLADHVQQFADPDDDFAPIDTAETIWAALRCAQLTDKERRAVFGYFWQRKQLWQVGIDMQVTESRVSQLCTSALAKLRRTLAAA